MGLKELPALFSSLVLMCSAVVGPRVVFAVLLSIRANRIFRVTQVRAPEQYLPAAPAAHLRNGCCAGLAGLRGGPLRIWPLRPALGHLAVLALDGLIADWLSLLRAPQDPLHVFWLPGKFVDAHGVSRGASEYWCSSRSLQLSSTVRSQVRPRMHE